MYDNQYKQLLSAGKFSASSDFPARLTGNYSPEYPVALLDTPVEKKFDHDSFTGPFLDTDQRETLVSLLDPVDLQILQEISKNDNSAMEMAARVNSYPDVIEEEFRKQLEGFREEMKKVSEQKKRGPVKRISKWLSRYFSN